VLGIESNSSVAQHVISSLYLLSYAGSSCIVNLPMQSLPKVSLPCLGSRQENVIGQNTVRGTVF